VSNACSADGVSKLGLRKSSAPLVYSSGYLRAWRRWNRFYQKFLDAFRDTLSTVIPAVEKRYRWDDFSCVQRLFFSKVNTATVRVLTANGCEVVIPKLKLLPCPNTKDRQNKPRR